MHFIGSINCCINKRPFSFPPITIAVAHMRFSQNTWLNAKGYLNNNTECILIISVLSLPDCRLQRQFDSHNCLWLVDQNCVLPFWELERKSLLQSHLSSEGAFWTRLLWDGGWRFEFVFLYMTVVQYEWRQKKRGEK